MTGRGDATISRDELRHATLASVRWVTVVRVVAETIGLARPSSSPACSHPASSAARRSR